MLYAAQGEFFVFDEVHMQPLTEQGAELTTLPRPNLATYFYCTTDNLRIGFSAKAVMPSTAITGSHTASLEFCQLSQLLQCTQLPALQTPALQTQLDSGSP